MFDKIEKALKDPDFLFTFTLIGSIVVIGLLYYLIKLNQKKKWGIAFMDVVLFTSIIYVSISVAYLIIGFTFTYQILLFHVSVLLAPIYLLWQAKEASDKLLRYRNMLLAGFLLFFELAMQGYMVIGMLVPASIFLVAGLVAEFKKLEK